MKHVFNDIELWISSKWMDEFHSSTFVNIHPCPYTFEFTSIINCNIYIYMKNIYMFCTYILFKKML
jgi:hypothetical protein